MFVTGLFLVKQAGWIPGANRYGQLPANASHLLLCEPPFGVAIKIGDYNSGRRVRHPDDTCRALMAVMFDIENMNIGCPFRVTTAIECLIDRLVWQLAETERNTWSNNLNLVPCKLTCTNIHEIRV